MCIAAHRSWMSCRPIRYRLGIPSVVARYLPKVRGSHWGGQAFLPLACAALQRRKLSRLTPLSARNSRNSASDTPCCLFLLNCGETQSSQLRQCTRGSRFWMTFLHPLSPSPSKRAVVHLPSSHVIVPQSSASSGPRACCPSGCSCPAYNLQSSRRSLAAEASSIYFFLGWTPPDVSASCVRRLYPISIPDSFHVPILIPCHHLPACHAPSMCFVLLQRHPPCNHR